MDRAASVMGSTAGAALGPERRRGRVESVARIVLWQQRAAIGVIGMTIWARAPRAPM
jgi:hypothetical protein